MRGYILCPLSVNLLAVRARIHHDDEHARSRYARYGGALRSIQQHLLA